MAEIDEKTREDIVALRSGDAGYWGKAIADRLEQLAQRHADLLEALATMKVDHDRMRQERDHYREKYLELQLKP